MKRSWKTSLVFGAGVVVGLAAAFGVSVWREATSSRPVATALVFENVMSAIRADFVDSLSDDELYVKAAKGVVSTLGDPYSAFLGPAEFRSYRDLLRGRGHTLGFTLANGLAGLWVSSVVPGAPADRSGLKPGDLVVEIAGQSVRDWTAARATAVLRTDSAAISIRVRPAGDSLPIDLRLEPVSAKMPAVGPVVRLSDSVGYLAIRTVSDNASQEVKDALVKLKAWDLKSLVIDLRGNLGGRLEEGLAIADLFLMPGQRIGTVAKRRLTWGYDAAHSDVYPHLKLTLLVDRRTASSAEIIAAALRDNDRATLVGERTYGKGLIQTTIPLGDSIAVRLTTGRWKGPGGRLITGGLQPDSAVTLAPWDSALRHSLARRAPVVGDVLARVATERVGLGWAPDSVRLNRADQDLLQRELRRAGLGLSHRTIALHRAWFDQELARLVASSSGQSDAAVRFGLLGDPVVAAGLVKLAAGPTPQSRTDH